jgi:uncharacterized protein
MVLDLKDIFAGGKDIAFDYELDLSGFEAAPGEFPIRKPVRVKGTAANRAGVVTLDAHAVFTYCTRCDRCLKDIEEPYDVRFSNILAVSANSDEDDDIIVCAEQSLDLDDLALTNVILNLSMKHLCKPDCKGLCPVCGKDLNEGDCGCDRNGDVSAFSQLKDLI